jgi:hypothetical protein
MTTEMNGATIAFKGLGESRAEKHPPVRSHEIVLTGSE